MTILADTWYVAKREMIKFFRARMRLIVSLIQPVIWLGLMGNMMQRLTDNPMIAETFGTSNYLAFMTPGIIIMTVLMGGIFGGTSIVWDRRIGYLEKLMAAPINRGAIPFGKMLAIMLQNGIQVVAIIIIAALLGVPFQCGFWGLVPIIFIAMMFGGILSSLALSLAASIKTMETLMALMNLLMMPLMFASNAMFPTTVMPSWLAVIAKINPVTYAVGPIRELVLHGWNWGKILPGAGVTLGLLLVLMLISQIVFRRTTTD